MSRTASRLVGTLALIVAFLLNGTIATFAGTTGALSGRVVDAASQRPLSGARVTASAPSGSATQMTDPSGAFQFLSLQPDTYTLTVTFGGYDAGTLSGITVQADQTTTFNVTLAKTLQKIGATRSRATTSLIQPGVSTDVYNISAAQQSAAAALGGGGGLNNAYSAIASVPGVFVPQGQIGEYQSIFIRGSNYTQVGYEYDGVPIQRAFDQYPGNNLSNLGQQAVQVYTGSAPTSTGSTALAGFVNQVIRTGTYPGFGAASVGVGGPAGYAAGRVEGGGASPDRNFNYYVGAGGWNQHVQYERGYAFDQNYSPPLDLYKSGCSTPHPTVGCYKNTAAGSGLTLGPNGYEQGLLFWGARDYLTDRDTVANFHIGIPHKRDGLRDDVQVLYNTTLVQTYFATAPSSWGPYQSQVVTGTYNGNLPCSTTVTTNCNVNGAQPGVYNDKQVYNGATGVALTGADLNNTRLSLFPGSPTNRDINAPQDAFEKDNYQQNAAIVKVQYQHNFDSRSYARLYGYTQYSDWLQYGEGGLNPLFYNSISPDYKLGSHTRGVYLQYANQLNDKHLLNFSASYTTSTTFRNNNTATVLSSSTTGANSNTVAFLVDSHNPTAGLCYTVALASVNCSSSTAVRYRLPGAGGGALVASNSAITVANAGSFTCGTGPCEFFTVANGNAATYNTVTPDFTAISLSDKFQVNPKLSLDLGLRYDDFLYKLVPTDGGAARQFWVNYFNKFNCFDPVQQVLVTNGTGGACAAGLQPVSFTSHSDSQEDYPELQPRFGLTYSLDHNNVLRLSAGKYAQPASSAFQQYDTIQPNFISANSVFYPIGFRTPSHRIFPEESYNLDASWEHQFNGTDASFKLTPYLRQTKNELTTVLLDQKTNFVSGINVGHKNVKGLEFAFQKGDVSKDGLYAQLSYTYTWAYLTFDKFQNGTDINTALNNAIARYNAYTSFCASNPTDKRCMTTFGTPATTSGGTTGAPCFTTAGVPDPSCAAGSVANPYWNMPVQSLFDPSGRYAVYNTYSGGARGTGSNQSYIPPHIVTAIVNYKHGPWNVTPTAQFQGGVRYGRPLQINGIDPAGGCQALGTATNTAGDPRYPGTQSGSPYNAATCGSAIVVPDPFVGHFDNYGQFLEPNKLSANLTLSYDLSKQLTLRVDFVNVVAKCWGGSNVPWRVGGPAGCDYGGGTYVSNFYNPGDTFQPGYDQPYAPNFGSVFQSTTAGQANPFQIYATLNVKI